jgi:putative oxidoreductase
MASTTTTSSLSRFLFGQPVVHGSAVTMRHLTALLARIALSAIFLVSGWAKLTDPAAAVGYMNTQGVPDAQVLVYVAGMAELLGGLSLMFGFLTRIGALGLFAFLAVTNFYFHDFWNLTGMEEKMQMVQFMKNLAIMGGLLMIGASGAGRYSLDAIVRGGGPIAHDYRDPEALTHGVTIRPGYPVRNGI